MVWIDNHAITRQYFEDTVKARKAAIEWMESNTQGRKQEKVYFYPKSGSRNYRAYVQMDNIAGIGRKYSWHYNTAKDGMAAVPLYKNGKVQRG